MNAQNRRIAPEAHTPAAAARRAHDDAIADLDSSIAALNAKIAATQAALSDAEAPAREVAALEDRLASLIGAKLAGEPLTEDPHDVEVALTAKSVEAAAMTPTAKGARLALAKLTEQLTALNQRRDAEMTQRKAIQYAQVEERLNALASEGERAAAPFLRWLEEVYALALVRDRLKPPGVDPCAIGLRPRFSLPAPSNLAAFTVFSAQRDISAAVEARGQTIMAELGVEARALA